MTANLGYQHPDQMENTLAVILGRIISDEPVSTGEGITHHVEKISISGVIAVTIKLRIGSTNVIIKFRIGCKSDIIISRIGVSMLSTSIRIGSTALMISTTIGIIAFIN